MHQEKKQQKEKKKRKTKCICTHFVFSTDDVDVDDDDDGFRLDLVRKFQQITRLQIVNNENLFFFFPFFIVFFCPAFIGRRVVSEEMCVV